MNLREDQKKKRKARVLSSIKTLLGRKAFEELTMDDIASASRISVGTLYNYFGSKDDMIIAFCREQLTVFFEKARTLVESPPPSAEAAYAGLLAIYMRGFGQLEKAMINFLIKIAIENQLEGRGRTGFQSLAFSQLREITRRLKSMGSLPQSAQEDAISFILFGICTDLLFQYSLCEDLDIEMQVCKLDQCVNLIYVGLGARKDPPARPGNPKE